MGLLSFLFNRNKETEQKIESEVISNDSDSCDGSQYIELAKENNDLCDGVIFRPTLQLRTPLWILKKSGEIYTGNGTPPEYGGLKHGCWTPHLKDNAFDFLREGFTPASDAMGSVTQEEYLNYAIGLLSIFEENITIFEKMEAASLYAKDDIQMRVEGFILKHYDNSTDKITFSIVDVMGRFISEKERWEYFSDKEGYLSLVHGINKTIEETLVSNDIKTILELKNLTTKELIKFKGIGKVSAEKIINCLEQQT